MLPSKSRLPASEFQAKGYGTARTPFFSIKTKKNSVGYPRVGVIIGKGVYKEATKRNFWKRQVKTFILQKAQGGNDLLILFSSINKTKAKLTKKQLKEDLESAVNKIK